jgi:hypothetical protein
VWCFTFRRIFAAHAQNLTEGSPQHEARIYCFFPLGEYSLRMRRISLLVRLSFWVFFPFIDSILTIIFINFNLIVFYLKTQREPGSETEQLLFFFNCYNLHLTEWIISKCNIHNNTNTPLPLNLEWYPEDVFFEFRKHFKAMLYSRTVRFTSKSCLKMLPPLP